MAYDFKKEQKELYRPGKRPAIIKVPPMNYLAVQGRVILTLKMVNIIRHFSPFMGLPTQLR